MIKLEATKTGATLYGVGVGPGDPELVTRKAWRLIKEAEVIAYCAAEDKSSFAYSIVTEAISENAEQIILSLPMKTAREPARQVYDQGAEQIKQKIDQGQSVVMLCEGDPMTYGSFIYVLERLRNQVPIQVVAGVSSPQAAAAAALQPLVCRNEQLLILPATLEETALEQAILQSETVVLLKCGRHLGKIAAMLNRLNLMEKALYIAHASLEAQQIMPLSKAPQNAPYFSLILICRGEQAPL